MQIGFGGTSSGIQETEKIKRRGFLPSSELDRSGEFTVKAGPGESTYAAQRAQSVGDLPF